MLYYPLMHASHRTSVWLIAICFSMLAAFISSVTVKRIELDPLADNKKFNFAVLEQQNTENQKIISQQRKEYRETQASSRDLQQQQREMTRNRQEQMRNAQQQMREAQQRAREAQRALKAN